MIFKGLKGSDYGRMSPVYGVIPVGNMPFRRHINKIFYNFDRIYMFVLKFKLIETDSIIID